MKSHRLLATILCIAFCCHVVRADDMDSAITKLTEDVAAKIKENGNKKVTVLDFTDLQGGTSELGRYVAEQLTVDFTMSKRDFSVLDRANLKRILGEHKLDASGLVNPENAKKLGMFSGVDAMLFGTITPVGKNINVTVKVISVETAEVVGGAKAKFDTDDTVQQMLSQAAKVDDAANTGEAAQPTAPKPKPFGDLNIKIDSFQLDTGDDYSGAVNFSLVITNTSATDTYGVAMKAQYAGMPWPDLSLRNSRGDEFQTGHMPGIECVTEMSGGGVMGKLTEVLPSSSIVITGNSKVSWNGKPGDYRPYRLQVEVFFGVQSQGRYNDIKKRNLVLDIK
ncbi:MAG: FlgO family outer membrane protein [Verrucomicrobiae bacterium]|nr:FlgO family outer membrane protein [Verrucomicrobiae bacterium]